MTRIYNILGGYVDLPDSSPPCGGIPPPFAGFHPLLLRDSTPPKSHFLKVYEHKTREILRDSTPPPQFYSVRQQLFEFNPLEKRTYKPAGFHPLLRDSTPLCGIPLPHIAGFHYHFYGIPPP